MTDAESAKAYRDELDSKGRLILVPQGDSMYPALRTQRDTAVLIKPKGRLKKYQVALYERADGKLVLHRVVKALKDGYRMTGDRSRLSEPVVPDSRIIGVMESYYRGERRISASSLGFALSARLWYALPKGFCDRLIAWWHGQKRKRETGG